MPRPRANLRLTKAAILWRLHRVIAEHEDIETTPELIASELKLPVNEITVASDGLQTDRQCEIENDDNWMENPFTGDFEKITTKLLRITPIGIQRVENWDDEFFDEVVHFAFARHDIDDYSEHLSGTSQAANKTDQGANVNGLLSDDSGQPFALGESALAGAPAADRVVQLDHNSQEYINAVEKLDEATEAIRKSNEPVSYDKEQVLAELSLGKRLLQSTKVRVAAVAILLLSPLYAAYQEAATAALKPTIHAAIEALKALVGL